MVLTSVDEKNMQNRQKKGILDDESMINGKIVP